MIRRSSTLLPSFPACQHSLQLQQQLELTSVFFCVCMRVCCAHVVSGPESTKLVQYVQRGFVDDFLASQFMASLIQTAAELEASVKVAIAEDHGQEAVSGMATWIMVVTDDTSNKLIARCTPLDQLKLAEQLRKWRSEHRNVIKELLKHRLFDLARGDLERRLDVIAGLTTAKPLSAEPMQIDPSRLKKALPVETKQSAISLFLFKGDDGVEHKLVVKDVITIDTIKPDGLKPMLEQFASKIRTLALLSSVASAHLVHLFGFGLFVEPMRLFLATQYCEGGTLEAAVRRVIEDSGLQLVGFRLYSEADVRSWRRFG